MKDVDNEEPTSLLDHVYLDALNGNANQTRKLLDKTTRYLNPVFLLEQTEKLPGWDKPRAKTSAWSYDVEGHARKCVERYLELANKKTEQLYKVSHPCLDDHPNQKGRNRK